MAGNTTNISIRMDAELKSQADELFTEIGMNISTAFNIFVRQSLREGGVAFPGGISFFVFLLQKCLDLFASYGGNFGTQFPKSSCPQSIEVKALPLMFGASVLHFHNLGKGSLRQTYGYLHNHSSIQIFWSGWVELQRGSIYAKTPD